MVHLNDAAYFAARAIQSRTAAVEATDVSVRMSHQRLSVAYEFRSREARTAAMMGAPSLPAFKSGGTVRGPQSSFNAIEQRSRALSRWDNEGGAGPRPSVHE